MADHFVFVLLGLFEQVGVEQVCCSLVFVLQFDYHFFKVIVLVYEGFAVGLQLADQTVRVVQFLGQVLDHLPELIVRSELLFVGSLK